MAFYVKCRAYTVGPIKTRDAAERRLAGIEAMGECHEAHEIVEAER
jgi:hypothetical protein